MFKTHLCRVGMLVLLLGSACDDDGSLTAPGADGSTPLNLDPGGDGNSALGGVLAPGEVRAGRVQQAQHLLPGLKPRGRVGDFKIYNHRVAFVIQSDRAGDSLGPYGGEVLDAALGQGPSLLGETLLAAMTRTIEPTSVGVVADGSDGQAAIVRVIGKLAPVPLLSGFIPALDKPFDVMVALDYVLRPDVDALELQLSFHNTSETETGSVPAILVWTDADGVRPYLNGRGFDTRAGGGGGFVALVGEQVSYAVSPLDDEPIQPIILTRNVWIINLGSLAVPAGERIERRFQLLVGEGDPEGLNRALRAAQPSQTHQPVTGQVLAAGGGSVAGARVHVTTDNDAATYVTMARTDADGHYALELLPGAYRVQAVADGHQAAQHEAVSITDAGLARDLTLGGTARLSFTVTDPAGASLPAKLTLLADPDASPHPAAYGEAVYSGGAHQILYHVGGPGSLQLAPGSYSVVASRGFEYETDTRLVTLADGDLHSVDFVLQQTVDSSGYLCGDFHVHGMWSYDATDLYEHKVAAMAAEGLEVPIATEHDYIGDFNPAIVKLGLQPWIRSFVGEEITTGNHGHFNVFPVTAAPTEPNNGALRWFGMAPADLFGEVRDRWPQALLQVNHPHSGLGYLGLLGYDPEDGSFIRPEDWSDNFDAVEVFTTDGWEVNLDTAVRDYFSLLDRGVVATATGNSDSHQAYTREVGYPRNCVASSTDAPSAIQPAELFKSIAEHRVTINGGALVEMTSGPSKGMGDVVDGSGGSVALQVKVQAPSWVHLDTLELRGGGQLGGAVLQQVTLDATTRSPTDAAVLYDGTLTVPVSQDTWIIAVAHGPGTLDPVVMDRQPFGMTNPILVDVDGNGAYDAPSSF